MKNTVTSDKMFFILALIWYLTFFSGIYFTLASMGGIHWGRFITAIDSTLMLLLFISFILLVIKSIKTREYLTALLATALVLWPIYWMYLIIYDTFLLVR